MSKVCTVCNHGMKNHKNTIHGPDGSPGPDKGKVCFEKVGQNAFGYFTCSCNGKRAPGLEFYKTKEKEGSS